jgi:hypothetical protein
MVAVLEIAMRIRVNLASLEQIQWHEYLTRFLLGGAITVATGLIARYFGPVVGGVFLAFPAILPCGATLIDKHERDKKCRAGIPQTIRGRLAAALDARGAALGTIALAMFALLVWKLLPLHNAALTLAGALGAWLALAILLWRLRKLHGRLRTRR